jgi:hypothetical protein
MSPSPFMYRLKVKNRSFPFLTLSLDMIYVDRFDNEFLVSALLIIYYLIVYIYTIDFIIII